MEKNVYLRIFLIVFFFFSKGYFVFHNKKMFIIKTSFLTDTYLSTEKQFYECSIMLRL